MDWHLFIGRFHPLVVHFPVALLVVAALMEVGSKVGPFRPIRVAIPFVVFIGTFTALISMVFGWLIAGDRGYDESTLFWHRWLGVSVFAIGTVICLICIRIVRVGEKLRLSLFVLILLLVSLTGHLGGALTHGENYLSEYAPAFIRNLVEPQQSNDQLTLNPNPDSVLVFRDLISPILISECMPCHDERQRKGGLDLTTIEAIQKGGDNGAVINAGKSGESELFRRISLPVEHPKFMPIRRTPLSFSEVSIIKWWIDAGASFDGKLTDTSVDEVRDFLIREFNYDPVTRPYFEVTAVDPADPEKVQYLISQGFNINPLANGSHYLSVSSRHSPMENDRLRELLAIKDQITWLDLSESAVGDEHLDVITKLPNLTRLNLHSNPISDDGIGKLKALKHLETLNLYKTSVSDGVVETIGSMPSIKKVFVWQTALSSAGIKRLLAIKPTLKVDTGFQFAE